MSDSIDSIANIPDTDPSKQNNSKEKSQKKDMTEMIAWYENIIDAVPGHLYWKDKNGVYLGCNQYMATSYQFKSKSDIIGKTDRLLWPDYAALLEENDRRVIEQGMTISSEERINGRTYLSIKMPLRDSNNHIIGIIGNSADITYLKEIEKNLREKTELAEAAKKFAKGRFSFFEPKKESQR